MTDAEAELLKLLRLSLAESPPALESRSGASVRRVRTEDGLAAYLKLTPASLGDRALAAARRELRFYHELAPGAPVRTAPLLGHVDSAAGVALLLAEAGEPRSAEAWTPRMWTELGRELAALHGMPLPSGQPDWHRPSPLKIALADPALAEIRAFWGSALPQLPAILGGRSELAAAIDGMDPVFTHGDCHLGNVVDVAGLPVLCDWQEARVGSPCSDLAFLSVRAVPSGVTVPPELIDAYVADRPCDRAVLERASLAEELAVLVFLWPPFAAQNSESGVARVHTRGRELARRWIG